METNTLAVKRILAMVLSVALMLTTMPVTALTAYAQDSGACAHVIHDEACGYADGADCTHAHGEDCAGGCVHTEHDGDCGYIAAAPCGHEHDENCGDGRPAGGLSLGDSGEGAATPGTTGLAAAPPIMREPSPGTPVTLDLGDPQDDSINGISISGRTITYSGLGGLTITGTGDYVVAVENATNIILEDNTVFGNGTSALWPEAENVTVTGGGAGVRLNGHINARGDLEISGEMGDIDVTNGNGICADGDLEISGKVGDIAVKDNGIRGTGITISGSVGNVTSTDWCGISANGDVEISGSVGKITATDNDGIYAGENLKISGSVGDIDAGSMGISAGRGVEISGEVGKITAEVGGISAKGSVIISDTGEVGNITSTYGHGIYAVRGDITISSSITVSGGYAAFNKQPVISLASYTATWSANADGSSPTTKNNAYPWAGSHKYVKIAAVTPVHTITASAGSGGSITPSGSVTVNEGESKTFTITPSGGYAIATVLVDGTNNPGAVSDGSYTFTDVTGDHTIAATFTPTGGGTTTHTITASAGDGGSISPSGSVTVSDGADQAFTITPYSYYSISDVKVDGVSVGAVSSYTFSNVTAPHTISATFYYSYLGGGSDSGSSSGGSSRGSTTTTATTQPSNAPVNVTEAVATNAAKAGAAAAKAAGRTTATANIKNPGNISLAALGAMVKAAGMSLKLQADSMNGNAVDVRITLDPALAKTGLNLSASTISSAAKKTTARFTKYFTNRVMAVSLGQKGTFGQPVEIAAKLDPKLNTENLVFYSYDKEANSYKRIEKPAYWIDKNGYPFLPMYNTEKPHNNEELTYNNKSDSNRLDYYIDANGYLHFTTEYAGDIIISEGPLVKK